MITAEKKYFRPNAIEDAIRLAVEHNDDFRFVAGGTDVIVNKFQGNDDAGCLIDISSIEELKKVSISGEFLNIGSLVALDDLKNFTEIKDHFPVLAEAAHSVASPVIRRSATIGGNILCENRCTYYNQSEWWRNAAGYCLKCEGDTCIATGGTKKCFSKFVSDTAPVLISMEAQLEVAVADGINIISLESIYTGDGINPHNLPRQSVIKNIILPLNQNFKSIFKKLRPREAVDFTSLTTVVTINKYGDISIVLGGVDPQPVIVRGTDSDNREELIKKAIKKSRIINNDFYSRTYRKEMIAVFLRKSFEELMV